jgi:hypothetical protein
MGIRRTYLLYFGFLCHLSKALFRGKFRHKKTMGQIVEALILLNKSPLTHPKPMPHFNIRHRICSQTQARGIFSLSVWVISCCA